MVYRDVLFCCRNRRNMERKKNQWHPGFAAAIRMELKDNREDLEFEEEHPLNKKPLQVDMLIIKNDRNVEIKSKIGKLFGRYNIVEYKSPDDQMGIDTFYKVIGYASLYKVSSEKEDGYKAEDITMTLVRQRYPVKLIRYLKENGCVVNQVYLGIYYVTGNILFKMQIIVSKDLDEKENIWLCSLQNNLSKKIYNELLYSINHLDTKEKEIYGEAVLRVVTDANETRIDKWKEETKMTCEALERIMAPELKAQEQKGRLEGKVLAYAEIGLSVQEIAEKVSLSVEEVEKIIAKN